MEIARLRPASSARRAAARYDGAVARVPKSSSPQPGQPSRPARAVIEPVGADLVALAQAHALDATTFPHQSLPPVFGDGAPPSVWIARRVHAGPVIGFIATRASEAALEISGLAVDTEHRRTGIARALVRAAMRSARGRGFDTVELHVSTGNEAAIALYTSERFRKARRVEGFYASKRFPENGDAWMMVRDLF
jgi:ribosomal-protein-alanine N-acetyltransferase